MTEIKGNKARMSGWGLKECLENRKIRRGRTKYVGYQQVYG